jgi:hypothetical protein
MYCNHPVENPLKPRQGKGSTGSTTEWDIQRFADPVDLASQILPPEIFILFNRPFQTPPIWQTKNIQSTPRTMQLHTVESSMIHAIGYDPDRQMLEVIFNSGKIYQYFEVPEALYDDLMQSDSKGSYFRSFVIDCFPYQQLQHRR